MDKAICDYCHADACRTDVYRPDYDKLLTKVERLLPRSKGGADAAVWGSCRWGSFRWSVRHSDFEALKNKVTRNPPVRGGGDAAVWGSARWGFFRWTVKSDLFSEVKNKVEKSV